MTNHKELADKIVALGALKKSSHEHNKHNTPSYRLAYPDAYWNADIGSADMAVNDPRVAMAMMEKCAAKHDITIWQGQAILTDFTCHVINWERETDTGPWTTEKRNESLPLAINMACVEALSDE